MALFRESLWSQKESKRRAFGQKILKTDVKLVTEVEMLNIVLHLVVSKRKNLLASGKSQFHNIIMSKIEVYTS